MQVVESLDDRRVKRILQGDMESAEKWNTPFVYLLLWKIWDHTLLTLLERLRIGKANWANKGLCSKISWEAVLKQITGSWWYPPESSKIIQMWNCQPPSKTMQPVIQIRLSSSGLEGSQSDSCLFFKKIALKGDLGNYRSVNLTFAVGKLIEMVSKQKWVHEQKDKICKSWGTNLLEFFFQSANWHVDWGDVFISTTWFYKKILKKFPIKGHSVNVNSCGLRAFPFSNCK